MATTVQSFGGVADYALAGVTGVFEAPPEFDDVEAAAFTLPFHTGYLAVQRRAKLQSGEELLVIGGATAVGTAIIQLGNAAGAHVIASRGWRGEGRADPEPGCGADRLHVGGPLRPRERADRATTAPTCAPT